MPAKPKVEEVEVPVPDGSDSSVLDALKTLTETVADLVEAIDKQREELALKKRAGVFDQKGVSK